MDVLASIMMPTRKGRFVCWVKLKTCEGAFWLSNKAKSLCCRFWMNRPCLSVTVKIRFTSLTLVRMVKLPSFCPLAVWPLLVAWGTEPRAPGWVGGGGGAAAGVCARAAKGDSKASENTHFASREPAGRRQPVVVVIETFFILEHSP